MDWTTLLCSLGGVGLFAAFCMRRAVAAEIVDCEKRFDKLCELMKRTNTWVHNGWAACNYAVNELYDAHDRSQIKELEGRLKEYETLKWEVLQHLKDVRALRDAIHTKTSLYAINECMQDALKIRQSQSALSVQARAFRNIIWDKIWKCDKAIGRDLNNRFAKIDSEDQVVAQMSHA